MTHSSEVRKRWCCGCDQPLPLTAFYRDAAGRPYGPCKRCRAEKRRARARSLHQQIEALRREVASLRAAVTTGGLHPLPRPGVPRIHPTIPHRQGSGA